MDKIKIFDHYNDGMDADNVEKEINSWIIKNNITIKSVIVTPIKIHTYYDGNSYVRDQYVRTTIVYNGG